MLRRISFILAVTLCVGLLPPAPRLSFGDVRAPSPEAPSPEAPSPEALRSGDAGRADAGAGSEFTAGDFSTKDAAAASAWAGSLGIADWLGPLAPVALSPFFGVTILSGLSLWGPEWATDNALTSSVGPLRSQGLFFAFLALTILTSVPRLTKVSKPFAQAVDRLEAYSVVVILVVVKVMMSVEPAASVTVPTIDLAPQIAHAGVLSVSADVLVAVAMAINILVINAVKFFFEFLVWLTPIPAVDAIFEACNKTLCAALMAVYALSPTVALVINLAILLVAALVFRWVSRRVRFYRTMVLDPLLAKFWKRYGEPAAPRLCVFPREAFGPFAEKTRLRLACDESTDGGWNLSDANGWWWSPSAAPSRFQVPVDARVEIRRGWVMHSLVVTVDSADPVELLFSRRYDARMDELLEMLKLSGRESESACVGEKPGDGDRDAKRRKIATEFA